MNLYEEIESFSLRPSNRSTKCENTWNVTYATLLNVKLKTKNSFLQKSYLLLSQA